GSPFRPLVARHESGTADGSASTARPAPGHAPANHQDLMMTFTLPAGTLGLAMTQIIVDVPAGRWPDVVAEVAAAVGRQAAAVHEDVYGVILREIPQLRD